MALSATASAAVTPAAPTLDRRASRALLVPCGALFPDGLHVSTGRRLGLARPACPGEARPEAPR